MILLKCGMGLPMTNWIMTCITSTSFVVLINGEATYFFRSGRGVREGCPLSPLLFILIMEGLSLLLKKCQAEGSISGLKIARLTKILHLLFVDDILILSNANLAEWREIDKLIPLFYKASGLAINLTKSTVHHAGLSDPKLSVFKYKINSPSCRTLTFSDLSTGLCYLGYFLKTGTHHAADWRWLVTKIKIKIIIGVIGGFH